MIQKWENEIKYANNKEIKKKKLIDEKIKKNSLSPSLYWFCS